MSKRINEENKENAHSSNTKRSKSSANPVLTDSNRMYDKNVYSESSKNEKSILDISTTISIPQNIELQNETEEDVFNSFRILLKDSRLKLDFLNHGQANELPLMTGLAVEKIGYISTPLTDAQVQQIIELQTNVNEENCDKYEINGKILKINNPSWNANLNKLVEKIGKEMGVVNESVHVVLDKMVIYQKGTKSKHLNEKEVETISNDQGLCKFANLELKLPSDFIGGNIFADYNQKFKQTYDLGSNSLYSIYYAASDPRVNVNADQIADGYRLTLEYSLYCQEKSWSPVSLDENFSQLEKMTKCLHMINQFKRKVWILFENQYDTLSLLSNGLLDELKGDDMNRFNFLRIANSRLPQNDQLMFLVAHLERCLCYEDGSFYVSWGSGSQNGQYDKSDGEETISSNYDFTEKGHCVEKDDFEINELIDMKNLILIKGKFKKSDKNHSLKGKSTSLKKKYYCLDNFFDPKSENFDEALQNLEELRNWGKKRTKRKMMNLVDGCGGHSFSHRYHKYALILIPQSEYF